MHTHASDQAKIYAKHDRIFLYLSLTFFVVVVGASWHRLFFGANHTDEAAYIAMPYRLFLGDRPLVDEYWISQFAAILLEPIVAAYIKVSGSTDGIILFFRYLYLVFNIITAIVFIRVLADGSETDAPEQELKGLPLWAALLIGSLCVSFVPYGIFNLGYNELAMGLLEIGALLLLLAIIRNKDSDRAQTTRRFLAGLLHGLAIVSYPTLSLGIAIAALLLLSWHQSRWVAFLSYVLGVVVGSGWVLTLLRGVSGEELKTAVDYMLSVGHQGGGFAKFVSIFSDIYHFLPHKGLLLGLTAAILILTRCGMHQARLGLLVIPAVLATAPLPESFFGSLLLMRNMAILAPVPLSLTIGNPLARRVFLLLWCPGIAMGLVTAWSSDNGAWNFAIGGFLATIATAILFWIALMQGGQPKGIGSTSYFWKSAGFFALSSITVLSMFFQQSSAYGESDLTDANVRIDFGPLRGVFTSQQKYDFYRRLNNDITSLAPRSTILFFYGMPLGYMLTRMRPLVQSLAFPNRLDVATVNRKIAIDYFNRRGAIPDYIVKVNAIPFGPTYCYQTKIAFAGDDPLVRLTDSALYRRTIHNEYYDIFSRIP